MGEHPSKSQIWKGTAVRRMLNDSWNSEETNSNSGSQMSCYHIIDVLRQEKPCSKAQVLQQPALRHTTQQMMMNAKGRFSCLVASKYIPCPVTGCGMYYTTTTSLRTHMMNKHPQEQRRTRSATDTGNSLISGTISPDYWERRDDGWMRYHIQPRLKYCQPDAGENGPDVNTLDGRRITRIQENGQDPEDVEDEWNVM